MLTILLIRGVTLDGAANGLFFYFNPEWSRLKDTQVHPIFQQYIETKLFVKEDNPLSH